MIDENKRAYKDLGFYILYFRKKRELTQRQLADLIDVNYETISRIENANTGLSLEKAKGAGAFLAGPIFRLIPVQ